MINLPICYKGEVTIKLKDKPVVKKHNSGTVNMFNLVNNVFSRALYDTQELGKALPAYIAIVYNTNINKQDILNGLSDYSVYKRWSIITNELPIVSRNIENNSIVYKSLLTNSVLISSLNGVSDSGYALLLDGTCSKILAVSDIELNALAPLYEDPLGESDIEWRMTFNNIEQGE